MTDTPDTIEMYGANWCPDCRQAKAFFGEQRIHYNYIDLDQYPDAVAEVERINNGMRSIPTIIFPDGTILVEPSTTELAAKIGLHLEARQRFYDVIIIGSGPAGLTARPSASGWRFCRRRPSTSWAKTAPTAWCAPPAARNIAAAWCCWQPAATISGWACAARAS